MQAIADKQSKKEAVEREEFKQKLKENKHKVPTAIDGISAIKIDATKTEVNMSHNAPQQPSENITQAPKIPETPETPQAPHQNSTAVKVVPGSKQEWNFPSNKHDKISLSIVEVNISHEFYLVDQRTEPLTHIFLNRFAIDWFRNSKKDVEEIKNTICKKIIKEKPTDIQFSEEDVNAFVTDLLNDFLEEYKKCEQSTSGKKPSITGYSSHYFQNHEIMKTELKMNEEGKRIPADTSITNFALEFVKEIRSIDEENSNKVEYVTNIVLNDGKRYPFNIDNKILTDKKKFQEILLGSCSKAIFKNIDELIQAFNELRVKAMEESTEEENKEEENKKKNKVEIVYKTTKMGWYKTHELDEKLGWNFNEEYEDFPIYVTKSSIIDETGIHPNKKIVVDIPKDMIAYHIDIPTPEYMQDEDKLDSLYQGNPPDKHILEEDHKKLFNKVGKHIVDDLMNLHDPYVMRMALSDTFGSKDMYFLEESGETEVYYLSWYYSPKGNGGQGKTFIWEKSMNFEGDFRGSGKMLTWASKFASIEEQGEYVRDSVFYVDDYRRDYLYPTGAIKIGDISALIHNYTKGEGKRRHTRSGYKTHVSKKSFVGTGENIIAHDTSNKGRVCEVPVPDIEIRMEIGKRCTEMEKYYSLFTGEYIKWLIHNRSDIKSIYKIIQNEFYKVFGIRDVRKSKMYAVRYMMYTKFCQFMLANKFFDEVKYNKELQEFKESIIKKGKEAAEDMNDADPGNDFIEKIISLRGSGAVELLVKETGKAYPSASGNKPVIGCTSIDDNIVYIDPEAAIVAIKRIYGRDYNFSKKELSSSFITKKLDDDKKWIKRTTPNYGVCYRMKRADSGTMSVWAFDDRVFNGKEGNPIEYNPDRNTIIIGFIEASVKKLKIEKQPTYQDEEKIIEEVLRIMGSNDINKKENLYTELITPLLFAYYMGKGWKKPEKFFIPPTIQLE